MDADKALLKFREIILGHGGSSSPINIWKSFVEFLKIDIESNDEYIVVQIGDSDVMKASYFDFCRELRFVDSDGNDRVRQIHAQYSCQLPDKIGCDPVECSLEDFSDINEYVDVIESLPEFHLAANFKGWEFDIYIEEV